MTESEMRVILRMALGGVVCGSFVGVFAGALLGVLFGALSGNVSRGLDGALLGGSMLAAAGGVYGIGVALTDAWRARRRPDNEAHTPAS